VGLAQPREPADEDTILFSMNDWPALKALGLYREEIEA
jgi:gentisate 1,2-dioxygenase